jgi:hypothetical protein
VSGPPPVAQLLLRYAEPVLTAAAALWLGWEGVAGLLAGRSPLLAALLLAGAAIAAAWSRAAWQRLRLRARWAEGPGVVEVTEGRIGYWGPVSGGFVALDTLEEVAIRQAPDGAVWLLTSTDGERLAIPAGAAGAERLPDVLGTLEGFDTGRVLAALEGRAGGERVLVWRRSRTGRRLPRPGDR